MPPESVRQKNADQPAANAASDNLKGHNETPFQNLTVCRDCGIVKSKWGWQKPCRGKTRLALRNGIAMIGHVAALHQAHEDAKTFALDAKRAADEGDFSDVDKYRRAALALRVTLNRIDKM